MYIRRSGTVGVSGTYRMFRQKRMHFETETNENYRDQKQFTYVAAHPLSNSTSTLRERK